MDATKSKTAGTTLALVNLIRKVSGYARIAKKNCLLQDLGNMWISALKPIVTSVARAAIFGKGASQRNVITIIAVKLAISVMIMARNTLKTFATK